MAEMNGGLNRRKLLEGSALALAGVAVGACAPGNQDTGNEGSPALDPGQDALPPKDLSDAWSATPESVFRNFVRVRADLAGGVAPWWWSGVYVAVTPDQNPRVLFAAEGCETKRVKPLGENRYGIWSKVMTVFKDPETREILNGKEFRNPFTGEMNRVEPNVIGSHMILEPDEQGRISERPADGAGEPAVLDLSWVRSGDKLLMVGSRDYPEQRPIPLGEYGTTVVDVPALNDPGPSRVEAVFSSVFLAPWQRFLQMPDQPGHAVWHAVGRKTHGFHELTPEYLAEAERYIPDVLAWAD